MIETPTTTSSLADQLLSCGDPRKTWKWVDREPDYVRRFDLDHSHVLALLDLVRQWFDSEEWPNDEEDTTWQLPIHAWRALAQLGAEEVIDLMLEMVGPMDTAGDDWYLQEFPDAFAMIGPSAFDKAVAYLDEPSQEAFPRIGIAHAMTEIAKRHPDLRDRAVMNLSRWLEDFENNNESYNAFLISYLLDVHAREAADVIERAFAANRVDVQAIGNWNDVRQELGVEGQGLVSPELASARGELFTAFAEAAARIGTGSGTGSGCVIANIPSDSPPKKYKSKARIKQKVKNKARQRQRKRGRK